jgi:hypothetical protein
VLTALTSPTLRFESHDLVVAATTDAEDPLLAEFFAAYDRAFILPSEKEEWDGFVECLKLNHGNAYETLASTWGPFREWVLLARSPVSPSTVIGGANLICFPLHTDAASLVLSMHLNYLFIDPSERGKGYLRKLIGICQDVVTRSFVPQPTSGVLPVLMFLEQNDPLKLTPEDYQRDSSHGGIDQVDRIRIWRRVGARIIDFPYVQPALSDSQEPDAGLMLSVVGVEGDTVDACWLQHHLERFFAISVMKGGDPRTKETSGNQLTLTANACRAGIPIPLLDPLPWLRSLGSAPPYELRPESLTGGLRTDLRKFNSARKPG